MSSPTAYAPQRAADPGAQGAGIPVLLLAWNYPPDNAAASPRPFLFAKYLRRHGYACTVVTAAAQAAAGPADVHCVPDRIGFSHKVVRKLLLPGAFGLGWVRPALATAKRLHAEKRFELILSTSPPVATHFAALALKRATGLKWVADLQDPVAGNPARQARAYPYIDAIAERAVFRYADALIANTGSTAAFWNGRYPQWAEKTYVMNNGYDPETAVEPAPIPARPYRVLAHVGALSAFRPPTLVLRSIDRLIARGLLDPASLRVSLLGPPTDYVEDPALTAALTEKGVLEQLPPVPLAEARRAAAEADYLFLVDITSGNAGLQVPSKILDYIRIGRPILALTTRNSPVDRILAQSGVPYAAVYPDLSACDFDQRVLSLLSLPTEPTAASDWFRDTFDATAHARRLAAILDGVRA
ncbi:MAG: glycosyltransferase [Acidobacteriota bacterium]